MPLLPSRLRSSSAPMNLRCFSVFAGTSDLLSQLRVTLCRSGSQGHYLMELPYLRQPAGRCVSNAFEPDIGARLTADADRSGRTARASGNGASHDGRGPRGT